MYGKVKNTCGIYTSACTSAQDTSLVHTTLIAKMHIQTERERETRKRHMGQDEFRGLEERGY